MKNLVVFTIIARNYLAHARVLMRSIADHDPDALRIVVLVDSPEGHFVTDTEQFETVLSASLPIPLSRWFHFKYSVLELSTAVKPYAFEWIYKRYGCDQIVYLDPDISLYSSLAPLQAKMRKASIILTPHLTEELTFDGCPNEISILQAGAYNLGFIAISINKESLRFLRWWQERLYEHCVVDTANGLFVDQKWIDLVPGMFDGVFIERSPGYNVAYWNLPYRAISRQGTQYLVNGQPLQFFHFSGFDPRRTQAVSNVLYIRRLRISQSASTTPSRTPAIANS
jgi:hypothetical protein